MNKAIMIAGLGFGDEGKGTMVDYLVRETGSKLVVRYNGGSQAGHNVHLSDGRHHTFSQLGSGSFAGADTFISKYMMFDPIAFANELDVFKAKIEGRKPFVYVDVETPIITPFHVFFNQIKENLRGNNRHGSCGKGIGQLKEDIIHHPYMVICAGDLVNPDILFRKLLFQKNKLVAFISRNFIGIPGGIIGKLYSDALEMAKNDFIGLIDLYSSIWKKFDVLKKDESRALLKNEDVVIFEGAQGILLDEKYGFPPHNTWSDITFDNARFLIDDTKEETERIETEKIGVIRTYHTRHGDGPFPSYDWTGGLFIDGSGIEEDNILNEYQGDFREGGFDSVLYKYAIDVMENRLYKGGPIGPNKLTSIALTHCDVFDKKDGLVPIVESYVKDDSEYDILFEFDRTKYVDDQLGYQFKLAGLLKEANPGRMIGIETTVDFANYLKIIGGVSVKYVSTGPTEKDKLKL